MSWILPSILASMAAVGLEYVYRARWFDSYWQGWWALLPFGILIQCSLFYSYRDAPRLLVAWSTFFAINAVLRVGVSSLVLQETLTPLTVLALVLIVGGAVLMRW